MQSGEEKIALKKRERYQCVAVSTKLNKGETRTMSKRAIAMVLMAALLLATMMVFPRTAAGRQTNERAPAALVAPTPPHPDTTVQLTEGTQDELVNAIQTAQGNGHVTRIVLKANTPVAVNTDLPHFDLTDGKVLIIDFNGGWIDFNIQTSLWFEAQHGKPENVLSIGTAGQDATLTFLSKLPDGLRVGDYIKVVSENTAPAGRGNRWKLGEAMKVKRIHGLEVTLEGKLMRQDLYKAGIRASRYLGMPAGLWLMHPKLIGDLSYDTSQIRLRSLIKPRIISPDQKLTIGTFISLNDTVEAIVTDPSLSDGVDGAWPHTTYGIYSSSSKNTWVYRTDGSTVSPNGQKLRHLVDGIANTPPDKNAIYSYGNDIGLHVTGLQAWDTLNVGISSHSGTWGYLYENLSIKRTGGAAGIGIRGDYHTMKNINIAEEKNGWQIYNEIGSWRDSPIEASPEQLVIDGGSTVVSGFCLFTSSDAQKSGSPMPIGHIYTKNSPYWESSTSSALFDLNYETRFFMNGDRIKVTGSASKVFNLSGASYLRADHLAIDLSGYKGDQITLFYAGAGSVVDVKNLTLIDPLHKAVFSGGEGTVRR
ncbi:MAG: hypothetical protein IMW89_02615 [Ktedonobacteraceae bacterium]|nr:hypothetical protein [Ktedonobacteraceae bacterium]